MAFYRIIMVIHIYNIIQLLVILLAFLLFYYYLSIICIYYLFLFTFNGISNIIQLYYVSYILSNVYNNVLYEDDI